MSATLLPEIASATARFMRRPAHSWVAWSSASLAACTDAGAVARAIALLSDDSATSTAARSSALNKSASTTRPWWSRAPAVRLRPWPRPSAGALNLLRQSRALRSACARRRRRSGGSWVGTAISCEMPVVVSRAVTLSRLFSSTLCSTSSRAMPAGIGGMPRQEKRASERQSAGRNSRSPCTTWSSKPVWLSA